MRVTRTVWSIYHTLADHGWVSAVEIARRVGMPRQNIKYALGQMQEAGLLERKETSPVHYRLCPNLSVQAASLVTNIREADSIFGVQTRKAHVNSN